MPSRPKGVCEPRSRARCRAGPCSSSELPPAQSVAAGCHHVYALPRVLQLLAHLVAPLRLLKLLDVFRRQLRSVDRKCHLVELAGELERRLVVSVVHPGQRVGADVEALVPRQDEGYRPLHRLSCNLFAVDFEHANAAAPHT